MRDKGKGVKKAKTKPSSSRDESPEREPRTSVTTTQKAPREHRVNRHLSKAQLEAEISREIDREIEEGLRERDEIEEDTPMEEERGGEEERRVDNLPTYTKLLAHIKRNNISSMRFPCAASLEALGILEDVRLLLRNMGMESFLGMSYPVHKEVTYQFLASVRAVFSEEYDEEEGYGHIIFKVKGKLHRVGFKRLSTIFGLSDAPESRLPPSSLISNDVWTWIADDARDPGSDKCNEITSPGVRYAAKVLSHTFYCRREPGGVNEDELKFLGLGLLPLDEDGKLESTQLEDYSGLGLIGVLVRRFIYYKYWSWTNNDSTPKLFIGNLITPILADLGINLGPVHKEANFIDLPYLKKTFFLGGELGGQYAYQFYSGYFPTIHSYVFLPNESLTSLPEHIEFNPAPLHLVPADHPPFETITSSRKNKKPRRSSSRPARHSDADDEGPLYGTRRYHFEPYEGTTSSNALRHALDQNANLLKWNKMQDSTIYKLKNSVKRLKRQMKKITSLLSQVSLGSGCQRDDATAGQSALPYPSYYDPPRPPRSPASELRRIRRNTAPPPRVSSNESPSVATADDDDDTGSTSAYY